jgi:hypothetical protein
MPDRVCVVGLIASRNDALGGLRNIASLQRLHRMPPELKEDLQKLKEPGPWRSVALVLGLLAGFYALTTAVWT